MEPRTAQRQRTASSSAGSTAFRGSFSPRAVENVWDARACSTHSKRCSRRTSSDAPQQPGPLRLLDTIREFALEQLDPLSRRPGGVRHRHADYFLTLSQERESQPRASSTSTSRCGYDIAVTEQDNMRAALAWALSPAESIARGLRDRHRAGLVLGHARSARRRALFGPPCFETPHSPSRRRARHPRRRAAIIWRLVLSFEDTSRRPRRSYGSSASSNFTSCSPMNTVAPRCFPTGSEASLVAARRARAGPRTHPRQPSPPRAESRPHRCEDLGPGADDRNAGRDRPRRRRPRARPRADRRECSARWRWIRHALVGGPGMLAELAQLSLQHQPCSTTQAKSHARSSLAIPPTLSCPIAPVASSASVCWPGSRPNAETTTTPGACGARSKPSMPRSRRSAAGDDTATAARR